MRKFLEEMINEPEFAKLCSALESGRSPAVLSGVGIVHRAQLAAALSAVTDRPVVTVCADENEAKRMAADMEIFLEEPSALLSGREFTFYNAESVSRENEHKRISTLNSLKNGNIRTCAASLDGIMCRTMPPQVMESAAFAIKSGNEYDLNELANKLIIGGYRRCMQVEGVGQFALRGGILDFFSPAHKDPVRCEFFGDELDSMGFFDVSTQRRTENLEEAMVLPTAETLIKAAPDLIGELEKLSAKAAKRKSTKPELLETINKDIQRLKDDRVFPGADRYIDLIYPAAFGWDYFPPDALIVLCEPKRLEERAKNFLWQLGEDTTSLCEKGIIDGSICRFSAEWDEFLASLEDYPTVMMDSFTTSAYPINPRELTSITTRQLPSYGGNLDAAISDCEDLIRAGYSVVIACQDKRRCDALAAMFHERGLDCAIDYELTKIPPKGSRAVTVGAVSSGFDYPGLRLALISEGQMIQRQLKRPKKKVDITNRQRLESFSDLSVGDLVVHDNYGIGRFVGIFQMPMDKVKKDYIKIAYAGTDSLYIPATQLDMISKYIGSGEDKPVKLSKMGGTDWVKAKTRTKAAVKELAQGLIQIQAQRSREKGYAFSPDSPWMREFENNFEYHETDDQLRCIQEIKNDMERAVPMDRLLCGDVGYGKTEVALRAVMKCILDGKQAAILVPTTVLAQQHYLTAVKRFGEFPVKIQVLSRFRTPKQMKQAIKEIATSEVDIIIGTHRLLQKDIQFHDLGLLIVDEEQRFGVAHKERLKEIARQVDVLTLSATPIPRTLNMALSGIRDMSTLEEPPMDRQPVQTYVMEHDWGILADAIRREIARGGQVYYLHNRVENIERTAARLSAMLEDVSVGVAHGQMDEDTLYNVMEQMSSGQLQVLVCTTIIETGIDIANVNTLIIEDADKMGLAQLHQLRGRVGRSNRRAYAYLTFRQGKVLTEIANKRLSAIREFAEFNSGFKIAMRDLEIRGAGNILGAEQSGHLVTVGYDMYLKLLEEAVLEEQGKKPVQRTECPADLAVDANIPESYVPSAEQRMDLYRRIAHIRTEEEADDMIDELIDRFGDPPRGVSSLIQVSLLRGEATEEGITEINQKGEYLRFGLDEFNMEHVSALYSRPEYRGRVKIEAGNLPVIAVHLRKGANGLDEARKFVAAYRESK